MPALFSSGLTYAADWLTGKGPCSLGLKTKEAVEEFSLSILRRARPGKIWSLGIGGLSLCAFSGESFRFLFHQCADALPGQVNLGFAHAEGFRNFSNGPSL